MNEKPGQRLSDELKERLRVVEAASRFIPCTLIVHSIPDASLVWMSERGLRKLRTTNEALRAMGADYHVQFFNPEDAADYVPKIMGLMERADPDEAVSYFQQVRYSPGEPFSWYLSMTRIFAFDEETGEPTHTITAAFPIDTMHHLTTQAARLLDENNFLRANLNRLHSLSNREKEILNLIVAGKTNKEMASTLGISAETVSTHRRNLKRKLDSTTLLDMTRYAQALQLM